MRNHPAASVLTLALAVSVMAAPAGAGAATDARCSFDPATATTNVVLGPGGSFSGTVFVNFEDGIAIDDADINPPDPACGTTSTVDQVAITGAMDRDDYFAIGANTADRGFEPGLTDEPGSSDEIEFMATVSGGTLSVDQALTGVGAARPTTTVLGKNAINMNADESDGVDADVTVAGPEGVSVIGDGNDDEIDARGGVGTPHQPFALPLILEGGEGDDDVFGGGEGDELYGSEGKDRLFGEGGNDRRMQAGEDADKLNGGDGKDRLFGEEGDDVLKGGPGRDYCDGGPGRDVFRDCETERD